MYINLSNPIKMSPPQFEWFKWYSQTNGGISYQGIKQRNMRHGGGDEAVDEMGQQFSARPAPDLLPCWRLSRQLMGGRRSSSGRPRRTSAKTLLRRTSVRISRRTAARDSAEELSPRLLRRRLLVEGPAPRLHRCRFVP